MAILSGINENPSMLRRALSYAQGATQQSPAGPVIARSGLSHGQPVTRQSIALTSCQ